MFGPIMRFRINELEVRLSPIAKDDVSAFIADGGLQQHTVTQYLGHRLAPVLEDELDWWEKLRTLKDTVAWGIYVKQADDWLLVGNTSLNSISYKPLALATSGFLIFRPEWWGRGLASYCHRARTLYAFDQLNLVVVRSAVMTSNEASYRALNKVGYVEVSQQRNETFTNGIWHHRHNLELVNPTSEAWRTWWHGEDPGSAFKEARRRTRQTLDWARQNIELL